MTIVIGAAIVKQPSTLHDTDNAIPQEELPTQSPIDPYNAQEDQYSINTSRPDKEHMARIINAEVIRHGGYLAEANKPRHPAHAVPERYPEQIPRLIRLEPSQIRAKDSENLYNRDHPTTGQRQKAHDWTTNPSH